MSTFHVKHQLDQTMDTDIKRIQLIGIFSESVLLIIGVVLFFLDYQLFALLLAIIALGGIGRFFENYS